MTRVWGVLSLASCLLGASASRIQPGVSRICLSKAMSVYSLAALGFSRQQPAEKQSLTDPPLQSLSGRTRAEAAGTVSRLLQTPWSVTDLPRSPKARESSPPLVVVLTRPFERMTARRLLRCFCEGASSSDSRQARELDLEETDSEFLSKRGETPLALSGSQKASSALAVGLERLRSGAVLLTLELPSILEGANMLPQRHSEGSDGAAKGSKVLLRPSRGSLHRARQPVPFFSKSSGVPSASEGAPDAPTHSSKDNDGGASIFSLEASLLHRLAAPLVEAADVLVMPLLHPRCFAAQPSQDAWRADSLGEMLWLGDGDGEMNSDACSERRASSGERSPEEAQAAAAVSPGPSSPAALRFHLSEEVALLLRAMKERLQAHASASPQAGARPKGEPKASPIESAKGEGESGGFSQLPRLPRIVVLLGEKISPALQEAVRTEVASALGIDGGAVEVIAVRLPGEEAEAQAALDRVIQAVRPRNRSALQIADALADFLIGTPPTGPPSSIEFTTHALATNACAAAFRKCLMDAKKRLSGFQELHGKEGVSHSFGAMMQKVLAEALATYDHQTRPYQVWRGLQGPLLPPPLVRCRSGIVAAPALRKACLEGKVVLCQGAVIRAALVGTQCVAGRAAAICGKGTSPCLFEVGGAYEQSTGGRGEAVSIENDARSRLRAQLVAALQKDAERFESLAPGILRKALEAADKRLMCLLPPAAVGMTRIRNQQDTPSQTMFTDTLEHHSDREKALQAAASASRDAWLCRRFCVSLLEIHLVLLQKLAKNFSTMAVEMSQSPLAALLRRQHSRPWLGVSLRPALSIASLLRMRGKGNLQGYSRYNAGPVQLLFGFTNDGEGLASGRPFAFRLQPKIHFDVEASSGKPLQPGGIRLLATQELVPPGVMEEKRACYSNTFGEQWSLELVCSRRLAYGMLSGEDIRLREDDNSNSEVAFDGDGSVEESSLSSKPEFIEANCGILTVLGGLAIDESVKVTANGWENETLDFIVYLVSDDTSSSAQSRLAKSNTVQQVSEESEDEHVAEPILAVRIPGVQGDKEKSNEGPAVLLYQSDPSNPTEIPLDTPAGPTTPFMIILKQLSYTEMQVTVYTWISGRVSRRSATGRWHSTAVNAGTGMQARNFRLHVNNSAPKALRVYGPRSGNWLTAEEGTCDQVDPPLVEVVPSTEAEPEVVLEAEPEVAAEAELLAKAHVATSASQEEP
ncbi:hypothetical protein cyc_02935 [Cyclospora cayetanensis]|uniref:Transmembrane protein n=1 Tax=Cyclospora cayetanensis TaxID=88456 RepID=A0A1D3D7P0_9EIME|nr:hypothetical protein cyc_02935 [Cyclospora cayetanensis]